LSGFNNTQNALACWRGRAIFVGMKARCAALFLGLLSLVPVRAEAPVPRPEKWAQRVEAEGLANFHRVTPAIFRSGQPTAEGMKAAERLGVRTVLSLRDDAGDEAVAVGTKLRLLRIPMKLGVANEEALLRAVGVLANAAEGAVLVHCQLGADRTGAVNALYRILVQDWPREEALRELREGGYGFGIEAYAQYLATVDLEKLKKAFAERVKAGH
jgi:protein tyrosine phosphatase (PTP) superfamily phosphohydrolase (DUF442 family)